MAGHIQVFALSRWLAVTLPVEYYEFARALRWSIPYFSLPWKTGHTHSGFPVNSNSYGSKIHESGIFSDVQHRISLPSKRLQPDEYITYFENDSGPEPVSDGWEDFSRSMFWLALIGGSLILLHALLLAILKSRKQKQRGYGVLAFPRFEIFLVNLAVPNICEASAALIRGGTTSGIVVGTLILVAVSFLLLDLLWFLTTGITFAKLVLYNEDNQVIQVGQRNPGIARVNLGPGNKGQWTWNNEKNSDCLTMLGPLFEDLRGPISGGSDDAHGDAPDDEAEEVSGGSDVAPTSSAQSMSRSTRPSRIPPTRSRTVATPTVPLTSSTSAGTHGDYQIIAPDDKTEGVEVSGGSVQTHAEAPSIQKLFMELRVYYTLLESVRRVLLGAMGGAYKNTWSSKIPVIILLCITSLQLFFLVLQKPFIKKRVQLVEIISVSSEVCLFALFLVLLDKELSPKQATIFGVSMLILFLMGFLPQIVNELYALRRQIKQLDTAEKCFRTGLRTALSGILLLISQEDSENCFPESSGDNNNGDQEDEEPKDTGNQGEEETNANERDRNSGSRDKNSRNMNRNSNRNRKRNRKLETTVP
uniref:TRP C-terminal domain-containing protein n=2 Tax=Quercus lobata TaxID=97700 RepID=A0A7N2MNR3_QUELO